KPQAFTGGCDHIARMARTLTFAATILLVGVASQDRVMGKTEGSDLKPLVVDGDGQELIMWPQFVYFVDERGLVVFCGESVEVVNASSDHWCLRDWRLQVFDINWFHVDGEARWLASARKDRYSTIFKVRHLPVSQSFADRSVFGYERSDF